MNDQSGPGFWDEGVRQYEAAADQYRDDPRSANWLREGTTRAESERHCRVRAEMFRRIAAAMRGGTP
jgi:hypothetical protein